MNRDIKEYITAANSNNAQKVIDELREQALKGNPQMTAEQWQMLKCFILAGAIAKLENEGK